MTKNLPQVASRIYFVGWRVVRVEFCAEFFCKVVGMVCNKAMEENHINYEIFPTEAWRERNTFSCFLLELGILPKYISQTSIFWHIFYQFIIDDKYIWGWRPFRIVQETCLVGSICRRRPCTWFKIHVYTVWQATGFKTGLVFTFYSSRVSIRTTLNLWELFSPCQCSWSMNWRMCYPICSDCEKLVSEKQITIDRKWSQWR